MTKAQLEAENERLRLIQADLVTALNQCASEIEQTRFTSQPYSTGQKLARSALRVARVEARGLAAALDDVPRMAEEIRRLREDRALLRAWWLEHYGTLDKYIDAEHFAQDVLG